jgi:hypothetical protein
MKYILLIMGVVILTPIIYVVGVKIGGIALIGITLFLLLKNKKNDSVDVSDDIDTI